MNTLLSQKTLDILNEMKQQSRTGATGFGQLTDKEREVIASAATSLKRNTDPEYAMNYLNEMEKIYKKAIGTAPQSTMIEETPIESGQPSDEEVSAAEQRGAVGFDTERGVFVDENGNEV